MRTVGTNYRSSQPSRIMVVDFRGIDLYNSPTNVALNRSPDAPNMIRDVPGKVRKRMGFFEKADYGARINGVFALVKNGAKITVVHAGTKLLTEAGVELYSGMNDLRSKAWQLGERLFICDGKKYLMFDGTTAKATSEEAYVPKKVISRAPSGGGTAYEPLNLIGSKWKESFLSDGSSTVYQLSYDGLDAGFVKVEQMTAADTWTELAQGTNYSFDAVLGRVTFVSAPPVSPTDGADNILITVSKYRADYESRINKCDMSALYGVNGAADRLFVTGNPDYVNYDWYSGMEDATYFPATSYCVIGLHTRIVGYSIIDDKLAAHKAGDEDGRNIILRKGEMVDEKAAFPIVNTLQGAPAASGHSFAYLKTEPLFFSQGGIFAITPADVNGERYSQNRSFFINNALENEQNKGEAVAVSYKDFYMLALSGKVYVLDSLLKSYEAGAPYSTHQYEAYLLTGIDARVLYTDGDTLRFGTSTGKLMEFYRDPKDIGSYNDCTQAISAHWDTPVIATEMFYSQKSFRYLALKLLSAPVTGVNVKIQGKGIWSELFSESTRLRYMSFSNLVFSKLTFSCDATPKAFGRKLRLARTDKIRFRFENGQLNEPFGLYNYGLEYQINGKIR